MAQNSKGGARIVPRVPASFGLQVCGVALCAVITACSPRVTVHGNAPDPERIAEILPGTHSRQDVELILGSPSSISMFDNETWYYIGDRHETLAFLEPEVVERKVVAVRFDESGYVAGVSEFGKERAKSVEIVERTTPTRGNEMTVFEQLIGNIGRFEKGAK